MILFQTINDLLHDRHLRLHDRHARERNRVHFRRVCRPSFRASRDENDEIHVRACSCIPCGLHRSVPFLILPSSCFRAPCVPLRGEILSYVCLHLHGDVRGGLRISIMQDETTVEVLHNRLLLINLTLCLPSSCLSS